MKNIPEALDLRPADDLGRLRAVGLRGMDAALDANAATFTIKREFRHVAQWFDFVYVLHFGKIEIG